MFKFLTRYYFKAKFEQKIAAMENSMEPDSQSEQESNTPSLDSMELNVLDGRGSNFSTPGLIEPCDGTEQNNHHILVSPYLCII